MADVLTGIRNIQFDIVEKIEELLEASRNVVGGEE